MYREIKGVVTICHNATSKANVWQYLYILHKQHRLKHKLKTAHFSEELVLTRDFKEFKGFQKTFASKSSEMNGNK